MRGMSIIVKTTTRWITCFILLYGAQTILYGHLTPGGGFAGGVILACAFIILTLAFGEEFGLKKLPKAVALELDSMAALVLIIALLGMFFAGGFFVNLIQRIWPGTDFKLYSGGIIPFCNIAIGLKVASSLFMVFIILSAMRIVLKGDRRQLVQTKKREG